LPEDIHDVDIEDKWSRTWGGDHFLSHIDNNWGIAIFVTVNNLRVLQRCEKVYIDGIFKTCPRPYTQFVAVHDIPKPGFHIGCVFIDRQNSRLVQTGYPAFETKGKKSLKIPKG
jgi:hypothetical protein